MWEVGERREKDGVSFRIDGGGERRGWIGGGRGWIVMMNERSGVEGLNGSVASSDGFPRGEGFGLDGDDNVDET